MRIIVNFSVNTIPVPTNNQGHINSYIHNCLGRNNPFHDTPSNYSISGLIGSTFNPDTNTLDFPNGGKIIISSQDNTFLNQLLTGIMTNGYLNWGMNYINIDFINETFYDGFNQFYTLSPILLKEKVADGKYKYVTINDPDFDNILTTRTLNKLIKLNEVGNLKLNLKNFKITTSTNGKNKVKKVAVKNVVNHTSLCILTINCNKKVAELLYNIGIGQSTGSGFGCICKVENIHRYKSNPKMESQCASDITPTIGVTCN